MASQELICVRCRHQKRAHSKNKCIEWLIKGGQITMDECPCTVKATETSMFVMGIPKEG